MKSTKYCRNNNHKYMILTFFIYANPSCYMYVWSFEISQKTQSKKFPVSVSFFIYLLFFWSENQNHIEYVIN